MVYNGKPWKHLLKWTIWGTIIFGNTQVEKLDSSFSQNESTVLEVALFSTRQFQPPGSFASTKANHKPCT